MTLQYAVKVEPLSAEDGGGYLATVPELPGCMSDGGTPEHALAHVQDAIVAWLEGAAVWQVPVPKPLCVIDATERAY